MSSGIRLETVGPGGIGPWLLPEDDSRALLMEISVDRQALDGLITVFPVQDMYLVPLGAFSDAIGLAIQVDTETGNARGFIFDEVRTFFLDARRGEVNIDGDHSEYDVHRTGVRPLDDIYVDVRLLEKWLPMDLNMDLYASQLKVHPDQPLPMQLRQQREMRAKLLQARRGAAAQRHLPRRDSPYKALDYPFIDQTFLLGMNQDNGERTTTYGYATYAAMDLLYMESNWYLSGDQDETLRDYRVTMRRRDIQPVLLGPLGARDYGFGHVSEPRLELISRPVTANEGVYVSSYPLHQQTEFDRHTFEGDLPPGWAVELYRNGALVDYQSEGAAGRYRFADVPLLFGQNYFRIVMYGPQGQVREETINYQLNESLTRASEVYYQAVVTRDDRGEARAFASFDAGLSRAITAHLDLGSLTLENSGPDALPWERHNYLSAGLRGFTGGMFLRGDLVQDQQSGRATNLSFQSRFGPVVLSGSHNQFQDGFVSEEFPWSTIALSSRRSLQLDAMLPAGMQLNFSYQDTSYENGNINSHFSNRFFISGRGFAASNLITLSRTAGFDDAASDTVQLSWRTASFNLRGVSSWTLRPVQQLEVVSLTMDGMRAGDYVFSTGVSRAVQYETDDAFFSVNRLHGDYALSFTSRYGTGGVWRLGLSVNMGIGREPFAGSWHSDARPMAGNGALATRLFMDDNLNGRRDEGEKAIGGARLKLNGGLSPLASDEHGVVFLTGLQPWDTLDVEVALESLGDPFMMPATSGVQVVPRAGHTIALELPVVPTGEIDGTTYIVQNGQQRHVSGAIMELVDINGQVVQRVKSSYDGFYLFSQVPLGRYLIRVDAEQAQKLRLRPIPPRVITMTPEEPVVNGVDFLLER